MKLKLFVIMILCTCCNIYARQYVPLFTPTHVIVADGFLQIKMPNNVKVEGCAYTETIVLPDDHKYFNSFLSLATTAFVSGKKLNVAIGAPCQATPNWPLISVMMLQN